MSQETSNPNLQSSKSPKSGGAPATERKIVVFNGTVGGEKRTFRLDKERLVLGSVISADVKLVGDGVAPIHAVLETLPVPVIYDLASETGVFVNGNKVITQVLKPGDEVTIGRCTLIFSMENRALVTSKVGKDRVRESEGRQLYLNPDEDLMPLLLEEDRDIEQIFDYRPTSKSALEVVMSWSDTILDVEHFVTEKKITIGALRKSDFVIPPLLSAANFPMVTRKGGELVLNLDAHMKGVMQRKGQLRTLDDLRQTASKGEFGHQLTIEQEDFAKIIVGDISFYLSFTQAPPRVKMTKPFNRDPFFLKVFGSSLVLTAVTLYALSTMRVVPNLEAEQVPERIATILYQPEKYQSKPIVREKTPAPKQDPVEAKPKLVDNKPKPVPQPTVKVEITPNLKNEKKPIPKEMTVGSNVGKAVAAKRPAPAKGQAAAKQGEGARAKGAEGKRGTKTAAVDTQQQNKAKIPDPTGGKGAGSSNSQVKEIGNVDFLKGASGRIENILAGAGAQLGKGGDRLKGFGGFDTRGNGGLALSGAGKGGGGSSEISQGLGNKGFGGGKIGTGLGAAGSGTGIIGGQARVGIRSGGPEEAVVMGTIDADAVEAALLAHKDEFRLCYEREINAELPNLAGRVGTSFVIGSGGRVNEAGIESSTLKNANVERCILNVIRRIDFPIPRGGGVVQVSYPFKYSPVGK